MKKGTQVKITKLSDERFNNDHPNGINTGYEKCGTLLADIELGYSIRINNLTTSWITEIIDENTFRTKNSIYKVIPYNSDYKVINNSDGITLNFNTFGKQLFIWNGSSEWYGSGVVTSLIELPDKIIINFSKYFTEDDINDDYFQTYFDLTDEELKLLLMQV